MAKRSLLLLIVAAFPVSSPVGAASPAERAAPILSLKNIGLAQLEEGKNAEARATFLKLAEKVPGEALPYADAAVAALRSGDIAAAKRDLEKAQSLGPPSSELLMIGAAIANAENRPVETRSLLARAASLSPRDLESRWRWVRSAEIEAAFPGRLEEEEKYLKEITAVSPSNLPALLKLLLVQLEAGQVPGAHRSVTALGELLAPMDARLEKYFAEGRGLAAEGKLKDAGLKFRIVENLLRVTDRYRQSLGELYTDVVGLPLAAFSAKFEESLRPRAGSPVPISFAERGAPAAEFSPEKLRRRADWNNDGRVEEYTVPAPYRRVAFLDYDADGDLDVYLHGSGGPDKLLRNNLDGTWTDVTAETGDAKFSSARACVEDLDRDGDLDIVAVTPSEHLVWRSNQRQGRFQSIDLGVSGALDVAAADVNADGYPDLVVATRDAVILLINRGDGTFRRSPGGDLARLPAGFHPRRVAIADLDNDGFPDVLVGGESGLILYRNAGLETFTWWPVAPKGVGRVDELLAVDANHDGAPDIAIEEAGRVRVFENAGANANGWLDIELQGLAAGSQKVNRAGVGSFVEVKAGDLYAGQTVSTLPTHIGLGKRARADVVRCVWTNGVPQNLFDQKSRTVIREIQQLKGSCPFVYARDGRTGRWSFISDALGRSPLGLLYDGVHLAGADPREWLRIPGDRLAPDARGRLELDYTEELWEVLVLDMARLAAVDHPAGTDFVPNERMVPGTLPKKLFTVARPRPVRGAWADGEDVRDLLARSDHRYVIPGKETAYQGVRSDHDLVLDLGPVSAGDRVMLYLEGWIFYTDTSVNVSISQRRDLHLSPPVLEVPDGAGGWKTAIAALGFPAGKTKTMPVDLTGLLDTADPRVRIRTNLAVFWDRASVTVNDPVVPYRWRELAPVHAELSYRGFSRGTRETADGPEVFDHDTVDPAPHWADIPGRLTRYGDVTALLAEADDRWVAMADGDAVRLQFDASRLPPIPPGWVRDWVLVSDGWDKDFDKNTVAGTTIGPYPFHAMSGYPYPEAEHFPDPKFLEEWVTRPSSPDKFLGYIRDLGGAPIR